MEARDTIKFPGNNENSSRSWERTGLVLPDTGITADESVPVYKDGFAFGDNMGFYGNGWDDSLIVKLVMSANGNTIRAKLTDTFITQWGINIRLQRFMDYVTKYKMKDIVLITDEPPGTHKDTSHYIPGFPTGEARRSKMFANLYEPIWLPDGTVNPNNYCAVYYSKLCQTYGPYVKVWEIVNEPDYTSDPSKWLQRMPLPGENSNLWAPIWMYIRWMHVAYEVIKNSFPDAYVTPGGLGYYQFYDALLRYTENPDSGRITPDYPHTGGSYMDVVSYHVYPYYYLKKFVGGNTGFIYYYYSDSAANYIGLFQDNFEATSKKYGYDGISKPKKYFIISETNVPKRSTTQVFGSDSFQRNFVVKALVRAQKKGVIILNLYTTGDHLGPVPPESIQVANSEYSFMGLYNNLQVYKPGQEQLTYEGVAFKTYGALVGGAGFVYDSVQTKMLGFSGGASPPSGSKMTVDGAAFYNSGIGVYRYVMWARTSINQSEAANASYTFPPALGIGLVKRYGWDYSITGTIDSVLSVNILLSGEPAFFEMATRSLSVGTVSAADKVYDGNDSAALTGFTLNGLQNGDNVVLNARTVKFSDKNAGPQKTVKAYGLYLSGPSASGYSMNTDTVLTTADIISRELKVTASAHDKVYDGTSNAVVDLSDDHFSSDDITLSYDQVYFNDKNAGSNKTITISHMIISGKDSMNYFLSLNDLNTTGVISSRLINIDATGVNKIYDGSDSAKVNILDDHLSNDDLSVLYTSARFDDKNTGTNKTITVANLSLSGTDAYNYTLPGNGLTTTADISSRKLNVQAVVLDKLYDGTTNVDITLSDDHISGDDISVIYDAASFNDKDAGAGKDVEIYNISLIGNDAGNYALLNTSLSTVGNILPLSVTVTPVGGLSKVYRSADPLILYTFAPDLISGDLASGTLSRVNGEATGNYNILIGTLSLGNNYTVILAPQVFTITPLTLTGMVTVSNKVYNRSVAASILSLGLSGVYPGDNVTLTGGTASFSDPNVGVGKIVTVSGLSLLGTSALNYTVNPVAMTTASISPKPLTGSVKVNAKVYDGTTTATIKSTSLSGVMTGDTVSYVPGSVAFNDPNAGASKPVTASNMKLSGTSAGNYTVNSIATTTASITPKTLTGVITVSDKVYDRTVNATILSRSVKGLISGDDVSCNGGSASFTSASVGTGKTVNITGLTISGASASNYTITSTATSKASITPLKLTGNITVANKVYDATVKATISGRTLTGILAGDSVTYSGGTATFADVYADTLKTVTATGLYLSGPSKANYSVNTSATAFASINKKLLSGTVVVANKVYDGTTAATITSRTLSGVVTGDNVQYTGGIAVFSTAAVGSKKAVSVTGLSLTGASARNYNVNTAYNTTANITALSITVTPLPGQGKLVGTTDPVLKYQWTPALIGTDGYTGALSRVSGDTVGTYAITQGTLKLSSNYTLVFTSGVKFTISAIATTTVLDTYGSDGPSETLSKAQADVLELKASPNPSTDKFRLQIESRNYKEPMVLRVYRLDGIERQRFTGLYPGQVLEIGKNERPGILYVELLQGKKRYTLKLIKLSD